MTTFESIENVIIRDFLDDYSSKYQKRSEELVANANAVSAAINSALNNHLITSDIKTLAKLKHYLNANILPFADMCNFIESIIRRYIDSINVAITNMRCQISLY